jgi:hypothetical protein
MKTTDKKLQRIDTEANSGLIRNAYIEILKEKKGKRPTVADLCGKTGLASTSVKKHLKSLSFKELSEDVALWRVLTDDVILAIYRSAVQKLNPQAQKLWMQVVEGWNEKSETKLSGEIKVDNKPPVIIVIE